MDDHISTTQVGWVLGRSSGSIRRMIREGEIEATRIPDGFRVHREEVLRIGRELIEERAGRKLTDTELERLVDDVLTTNEARMHEAAAVRLVKPKRRSRGR